MSKKQQEASLHEVKKEKSCNNWGQRHTDHVGFYRSL